MNCTDVAAIIDDQALSRLSAADRCALDEHVTGCEPCSFACQAQSALLAMWMPAAPADLLERVLRAMSARPARGTHRARTRAVLVGALLTAGAALAAVTAVRMLARSGGEPATSEASDAGRSAQTSTATSPSSASDTTASTGSNAIPVALDDVDIEYSYVLRTPPVYPPEALEHKLEGDVTLEFAIDEHGAVKNAHAVRSSDPLFESSAVAAISQWRYLPRVRAGKPVAIAGMQTVLRFQLEMPPPPTVAKRAESASRSEATSPFPVPSPVKPVAGSQSPAQPSANTVDFATFEDWITKIWQRLAAEDLRGAELALDELRATYDLDEIQNNRVWTFYGYIYTRYADYGRAIDAYEKALGVTVGYGGSDLSTSIADLYFARHQYDKALKTLLAQKQQVPSGRVSPEATALIEKLRALGVTEETL
jgi:TonB family protein